MLQATPTFTKRTNQKFKFFFALCVGTAKKKFLFYFLKKLPFSRIFVFIFLPPPTGPGGTTQRIFFFFSRVRPPSSGKMRKKKKRATLQRPEPPAASRPVVGTGNRSARCRTSPRDCATVLLCGNFLVWGVRRRNKGQKRNIFSDLATCVRCGNIRRKNFEFFP